MKTQTISESRENHTSMEAVRPDALLPLLWRLKALQPENYTFIVKTLCIYGQESPAKLIQA